MWIKIIKSTFWGLFITGVLLILSLTNRKHNEQISALPNIFIKINGENAFLTQKELLNRLKRQGYVFDNQTMKNVKINTIEQSIEKMSEVKEVSVYKSINNSWNIDILLRKPIARIFNRYGESFYVDEEGYSMSTSPLYTARVLVFTGDIKDRKSEINVEKIINNRTLKTKFFLDDIYRISYYVCSSPFWSSLLGQVHIEKNGDMIMIPQVGDFKIIFGKANNTKEVKEKMDKLWLFYSNALPYEGWNKYQEINLKFKKQIVCKKKLE
ncbi:MAG: FtsQ-type POTRA domain-containing protein [Flavobacteriia bacterium]|nr:FtsQ-type POTRA domain-containing protein [Flavobacteriia bacterium]